MVHAGQLDEVSTRKRFTPGFCASVFLLLLLLLLLLFGCSCRRPDLNGPIPPHRSCPHGGIRITSLRLLLYCVDVVLLLLLVLLVLLFLLFVVVVVVVGVVAAVVAVVFIIFQLRLLHRAWLPANFLQRLRFRHHLLCLVPDSFFTVTAPPIAG